MSWDALTAGDKAEPAEDPSAGDYGKQIAGSFPTAAGSTAGALQYFFDAGTSPNAYKILDSLRTTGNKVGQDIRSTMSEESVERADAPVTSEKFREHPISSMMLKVAGLAGPAALAALPGGIIKGVAGQLVAGTIAGSQSMGDLVGTVIDKTKEASDEQLQEDAPMYREMRQRGVSEDAARDQYNSTILGLKPLIAFTLGAGSEVLGVGGNVIRGVTKGGVRHGIGKSLIEGGVSEAADEGYGELGGQQALIEGGQQKDVDWQKVIDNALTGGAVGGVVSGVSGIGGGHGKGKAKLDEIRDKRAGADDAGVQAPAVEDQVAAGAQGQLTTPAKAKAAEEKGVTVGVDPAVREALEDKTQAAPAPQQPVEPPVPAAPAQPPAQPPAPPAPPPQAVQPQQAPTVPPTGPAAGVTSEVTPPVAQQGAAPQQQGAAPQQQGPNQHPPEVIESLKDRAITSEEAAKLTPEQAQELIQKLPVIGDVSAPPPTSGPTDVSSRARTTPSDAFGTDDAAAPTAAPTGRVLQSQTPEAKAAAAATRAAQAKAEQGVKVAEAKAEAGDKAPGTKKLQPHEREAQAARAKTAEDAFGRDHEPLEFPATRPARAALATKLDDMVKASGLERREDLPEIIRHNYSPPEGYKAPRKLTREEELRYHQSIPTRVGDKGMSPHVRYLREAIGLQKALASDKFGPKSDNYRRVQNFITAHNEKSLDLIGMSRKEAGDEIATQRRGGTAEQGEGAVAKAEAGAATKGAVKTTQSQGAASEAVTLQGEARAKAAAEVLAKIKEKAKQPEAKAEAAPKETAPKGAKAVAQVREKAAEPKAKHPHIPDPSKGERMIAHEMSAEHLADPNIHPHAREVNTLRRWVNSLSDADYNKLRDNAAYNFPRSMADTQEPGRLLEAWQQTLKTGKSVTLDPDVDYSGTINKTERALDGKVELKAEPTQEVTREVTAPAGMSEKARHAALRKWMSQAQINELSVKDQIAFLKDPPPVPEAAAKPPPKPRDKAPTQDEIDAAEHREELLAKIEREEQEREAFKKANETKARPAATQAATAEDLAQHAPRAAGTPEVTRARAKREVTPAQRADAIAALKKKPSLLKREVNLDEPDLSDAETTQILDELHALHLMDEKSKGVDWDESDKDVWETPLHKARDVFGHKNDSIAMSVSTADVLRNLKTEHLRGVPKYVQEFVKRRLTEVLQNVKLHVADANLIRDMTGDANVPAGFFHPSNTGPGYIAIRADILSNPREFTHTVIHEALHAALYHKLESSKPFRDRIQILKDELERQAGTSTETVQKDAKYGLTNLHEFVSEALSNPRLQAHMLQMSVSPELAQRLNLPTAKPWTLWGAFTEKVREILKLPVGTHNLLHEALRVIGPELQGVRNKSASQGTLVQERRSPQLQRRMDTAALRDAAVERAQDAKTNVGGGLARAKDKLSSAWMLAQRATKYFGELPNKLFEARAFMERAKGHILEKYGGLRAEVAIARAERTHPDLMARAKDILFDASLHDVNLDGSNDHLGKDKLMGVQGKNEVARLQRAWNDPALNPVRKVLQDATKFYRDIHNAVSRETINNILAEANIHDPAMAERIHNAGLNEADREKYKNTKLVNALDNVQELKRRQGTYVPFRRYGEFSSTANHELSVPGNATKINDNTLQFVDPNPKNGTDYGDARARAAVKGYLRSNDHTPQGNKLTPAQIRKVWVDRNDTSKILEAEDANAIPAYRVSMQTQHTEFHATQAEAERNKDLLTEAGLVDARTHVRDDAAPYATRNIQGAMGEVLRSLEKQQRYIDADATQKAAMRDMFHDLTLGLSGTTSIKNSMRQRRNVAGMSHDLGRVTGDYARMTANHLAMLQHRPKIDKIFAEMREYKEAHKHDNNSIRRDEIYKQFVDRIYGRAAQAAEEHKPGAFNTGVTRLLQVSRLSRLAGPSFHIINAHEPWTTSLPTIGGRHGFAATIRQLTDSYNFIGGRAGVMAGLRDTARAYTNDSGFTDYVKLFKDTIGKSNIVGSEKARRMQDMIDYMDARNLYGNSAIFEVGKHAKPDSNVAGRALDRADLMANQVGSAIEAINRTVTGLTAYNLEYKKNGGNHEAAMHYAYNTAHETMGDYSSWNAAPIFNSKFGRAALQFKKFGHKTYYLLGNIMGGVIKGDRQAMKQFAGLMVTHGLLAGVMGLPTEPFKVALMAANALGLSGFTPDDYEYAVRQLAARLAGQKGGEIISKGLYRGIGIEASGRFGLDSLMTFGAPKSQKDADIKSFLFDTMAGAPVGYLLDQVKAVQALAKGDVATAIEKASPLRTVSDITKAVVGASGDKKGPTGKTTQQQFSAWDTAVRAAGFTPSSAAEMGAERGTIARQSKKLSADRSELVNAWVDASGAKKVAMQRAVQEFNADHPKNEQITQKDLTAAARRRETDATKTKHGVTTTKRIKAIQDRAESVFNP